MTPLTIYIGNTSIIELQNLTNSVTGLAVTNATVVVTLTDGAGDEVSGQTWPVTLTHVAAGTYRATLENDIDLVAHRNYTATVDATVSGVGVGRWTSTVRAVVRS